MTDTIDDAAPEPVEQEPVEPAIDEQVWQSAGDTGLETVSRDTEAPKTSAKLAEISPVVKWLGFWILRLAKLLPNCCTSPSVTVRALR